jgi:adenylate kinase family enzyme
MQKVIIIGPGGAGKSTFAQKFAKLTKLPLTHLDALYWKPGWQRTPKEEWQQTLNQLLAGKRWVVDGNYASTLPQRVTAADTIIFFDYPKYLCVWRSVLRLLRYHNMQRTDLGGDNTDRISWQFLRWIMTYPRQNVYNLLETNKAGKQIVVLRSPQETKNYLTSLGHLHD